MKESWESNEKLTKSKFLRGREAKQRKDKDKTDVKREKNIESYLLKAKGGWKLDVQKGKRKWKRSEVWTEILERQVQEKS